MPILVPNSASTYGAAACVPGSENKWAWLGFAATPGGSGSVMWYRTASAVSGCEMLPIVTASGGLTFMSPVAFNSPCGFYAGNVSGGCAVAWLKQSTH